MAIRFNNNQEFFHGNREWYLRAVREPCLALAEALAPAMEAIDDEMERRPNRVVSRINRDIRFSRDKSPYRDYMWLAFRRPRDEARRGTSGMYCDVSVSGCSFGMGFYNENRPLMNGLRRRLISEPEAFLQAWQPARNEFTLCANSMKRVNIPENLPMELLPWYPLKSFYLEKQISDFNLIKSPGLAEVFIEGFNMLKPLYDYIWSIMPEIDTDETRIHDREFPFPDII